MKKLSLMLVIAAGLLIAGCGDLLEDVDPSTSITDEEALTSVEGVESLRASLYSSMRASFSFTTQNLVGPGALADESGSRTGATRFEALNNAVGTSGTTHLPNYNPAFELIQIANLLISGVEEGVLDEGTLNQYRGEAYAIRAYAYHNLAKTYGYEPGMTDMGPEGNWDLAVPLRTEPVFDIDDVDNRERATVDEVYNQILSDLGQAKTLLAGVADNTIANEGFVDGLTARVHLYAGNWEEAAEAAQEAIATSGRSLENTAQGVGGMFFESQGNHPEALLKIVVNPDTEPIADSNVNNGLAGYTSAQWVAQLPTQFVLDLYDEDDYRLGSFVTDEDGDIVTDPATGVREYEGGWFQPCFDMVDNVVVSGCDAVNAQEFSSNKWNGDKGNLADDIPLMRVSEMYLIWAEAAAKDADLPAAGAAPLQELRDARNAGDIPAAALVSIDAFEDEILNERVRELNFEGHRFFDLKRLGRDIPNPAGGTKISSDSFRMLAPLGNSILNANPSLVENPVY
jgi:starch-binding outer membrane protein, SusD/RagB family